MKKAILLSTVLLAGTLTAFVNKNHHTDVYRVDVSQSSAEWYAQKVTGKHNGTVKLSGGEITNDHGTLAGFVEMDMTTIENSDLQPGKGKEKLEGHLKSPDFFDAAGFPKAKFVITSITPLAAASEGGHTHLVKGLLTIKEKTNEITFEASVNIAADKATCAGTAVVDRSKFDVKYGSKSFFPDIGDKMIYDEFSLKFNVVALK